MTVALPQVERPTVRPAVRPLRLPSRFDRLRGAELRDRMRALRSRFGFGSLVTPPDANAKLARGGGAAAVTLAPATTSGLEVCPGRSQGCSRACVLWMSGHGRRDSVRDARIGRTRALAEDPQAVLSGIVDELERLASRRRDPIRAVRLNCASDLLWERIDGFLEAIPGRLGLFDYTKLASRVGDLGQAVGAERPYRLAYSISERAESPRAAGEVLARGGCAVLVIAGLRRRGAGGQYRYQRCPDAVRIGDRWYPATGGDELDRRDLDPYGSVVALAGKGPIELPTAGGQSVGERFALSARSPALAWRAGRRLRGF